MSAANPSAAARKVSPIAKKRFLNKAATHDLDEAPAGILQSQWELPGPVSTNEQRRARLQKGGSAKQYEGRHRNYVSSANHYNSRVRVKHFFNATSAASPPPTSSSNYRTGGAPTDATTAYQQPWQPDTKSATNSVVLDKFSRIKSERQLTLQYMFSKIAPANISKHMALLKPDPISQIAEIYMKHANDTTSYTGYPSAYRHRSCKGPGGAAKSEIRATQQVPIKRSPTAG